VENDMNEATQQSDVETTEQIEMGELWDGEKWIESPLVPFGYYAKSLEHQPEPLTDTSYWIVD
jgi:hypothetical protein